MGNKAQHRFSFLAYFKTRALKQIIQWLIVSAVSIILLSAFAVADAYAQGNCADLEGLSTPVGPPAPKGDEGRFDFTDPPNPAYSAKICEPATVPGDFELTGWVWDDNLGWISLYCNGGTNQGISCGGVDYGVKINLETGDMYGWAWGENIGWISFSCEGGLNEGSSCGGINYNGNTRTVVDADLGQVTGYAWADTVGWYHLDGINAKILDLMMVPGGDNGNETTWGVWTKAENTEQTGPARDSAPNKNTAPSADLKDNYDIFVRVADINGNLVTDPAVIITINSRWEDKVQLIQTEDTTIDYSTNNNGPVKKPLIIDTTSTGNTSGGNVAYFGRILSSAPTDDMLFYDANKDGLFNDTEGDFYYRDLVDAPPPSLNQLRYLGTEVFINHTITGETWSSGVLPPLNFNYLSFVPFYEVDTFNYLRDPTATKDFLNTIESFRNKADYFNVSATQRSPGTNFTNKVVRLELQATDPNIEYGWIDEADLETPLEELAEAGTLEPVKTITNLGTLTPADHQEIAFPYDADPGAQLQQNIMGQKAQSIIEYTDTFTGDTIRFPTNGMPRLPEVLINQVAKFLSGSVYSPGAKEVAQDAVITLLGDIATARLREQVLKNVSSLIAGAELANLNRSTFNIFAGMNPSLLNNHRLADGQIYYFENGDVVIDSLIPIQAGTDPVTVIVQDGDLYLNTNIDTGSSWGFIVLESSDNVSQDVKGGHIYIHNNVTDLVNTHFFADGPIYPYVDGVCLFSGTYGPGLEALNEVNFVEPGRCTSAGTFKEPTTNLTNQLYIKGTAASLNCIGCSVGANPYRGDGKDLGGATATNYSIARLFDFNYARYFRISAETGVETGLRSNTVQANPSWDQDFPVYFDYAPPTGVLGFVGN